MSAPARGPSAREGARVLSLLLPLLCGVAALLPWAPEALSHGGPPLRIGVTTDPMASAVGRLALAHLREGVGFGVDWREFADEGSLRAAFRAGRIDIAVGRTAGGEGAQPAAGCPAETLPGLREGLRREWGGEVFLLGFPAGAADCERPALIVAKAVLEDLRFGILGKEAARFCSAVGPADVAAVREAAARGGERAAAAAARAAMAAKAKR